MRCVIVFADKRALVFVVVVVRARIALLLAITNTIDPVHEYIRLIARDQTSSTRPHTQLAYHPSVVATDLIGTPRRLTGIGRLRWLQSLLRCVTRMKNTQ
jgi:hypothetical protein